MKNNKMSKGAMKAASLIITFVMIMSMLLIAAPKRVLAAGNTYYVDSGTTGSDSNDGLSESSPWKSLDKVNNTTFQPGDRILFKAGGSWTGKLAPKGSGTDGNPITINMYGGTSPKPRFDGNALVDSTVEFINQQYWEIYNLEITNMATDDPNNNPGLLGDYRGIHVAGQDAGTLNHFVLKDLYIHDVTGWVKWISGSTANDEPNSGIYHGAGWDGSKRTGGILFEILQPGSTPVKTNFNDVTIENCALINNSWGGIIFKQWEGTQKWASRDEGMNDPEWVPHTNITVRNNYLNHTDVNFGCDTIYFTSIKGGLVEGNVSVGAGTAGIEMYYTDNVIIQHNEVADTIVKAGGADSCGIDPDKQATNIIIQYNYIHGTGDGILLCGFTYGSSVVRYNVIKDAEKRYINPHSSAGTNLIYNNVFYNTREAEKIDLVASSGGSGYMNDTNCFYKFYNNIFYNAANVPGQVVNIGTGMSLTYDHNVYYGSNLTPPSVDINAVSGDPKFMGPIPTVSDIGTIAVGPYLNLDGFKLQSGSSAIGSGINITPSIDTVALGNGGIDYCGNSLYHNKPDMGIFEYYGDTAAAVEAITGVVKDNAGNPLSGAMITVTPGGYTAATNASGYYSITNIPVGTDYIVTATKEFYYDGTVGSVAVTAGDTTSGVNLALVSTNPKGSITGLVRDASNTSTASGVLSAAVLEGVAVTAKLDGVVCGTTTTDADGRYIFSELSASSGRYSISVSKAGYQSWSVEGLTVTAAQTTSASDIYLTYGKPNYIINDTFESSNLGDSPNGWSTKKGASDTIAVAANPSGSGKVAQISHGSTSTNYTELYKDSLGASGIFSMEYKIYKNNQSAYWNLPFVYGDGTTAAISVGMDQNGYFIYKYNGGSSTYSILDSTSTAPSSTNTTKYSSNTWYKVKIVLNTISQKCDIYVDGVKRLSQVPFRTLGSSTNILSKVDFYSNYSKTGTVYLDDFRMCSGIAYAANDTQMDSLTVSTGELMKVDSTHYYTSVPNYVDSINITPTASSIFAQGITVKGIETPSGQPSSNVSLKEGDNEIPVVVTAEDGTTQTYIVKVNRTEAAIDSNLKALSISSGTLTPEFSNNTMNYTVSVPYNVSSIKVTPTASASGSLIMVNDISVSNGLPSQDITLEENKINTIKIDVFSPDGTNQNNYSIAVTRDSNPDTTVPKSTDTTLKGITVDGKEIGNFGPEAMEYTVILPSGTNFVPVVAGIANDEKASVAVTQADSADGTATIVVTAENGTTIKQYTVIFIVDNTAPTTTASADKAPQKGWYSSDVKITLSATDDLSGVDKVEYRIGESGEWSIYESPVNITQDGTYKIQYRSIDKLGNVEAVKELVINLDKTLPTFSLMVNGNILKDGGTFDDYLPMSFSATDNLSGIATAEISIVGKNYSINTQTQENIEIDLSGKPGTWTAVITVEDMAGNKLTSNFEFTVATNINSIRSLIHRFEASGKLSDPLMVQLVNSLNQAQHQLDKSRSDNAATAMMDFIKHLDNKALESFVDNKAMEVLKADAQWLINDWIE